MCGASPANPMPAGVLVLAQRHGRLSMGPGVRRGDADITF